MTVTVKDLKGLLKSSWILPCPECGKYAMYRLELWVRTQHPDGTDWRVPYREGEDVDGELYLQPVCLRSGVKEGV